VTCSSTISSGSTFASSFNNNVGIVAGLVISGVSLFQGGSHHSSSLNVSGFSIFQGASTCISSLFISGTSIFQNPSTCSSTLNHLNLFSTSAQVEYERYKCNINHFI
jgi:hypothetical protein